MIIALLLLLFIPYLKKSKHKNDNKVDDLEFDEINDILDEDEED